MHPPRPPRLYTGTQAAALATTWRQDASGGTARISRSAICNWVTRGYLPVGGLDERGRPMYARTDLARAEAATRDIALQPHLATRRTPAPPLPGRPVPAGLAAGTDPPPGQRAPRTT